ncbi:MAG: HAMP domain-containing histidine kinase [Lachnospiraceae bacterium]|nr:HAMP domain-containing histidine kinase [Lachnospiraceae bacterium]
MGRLIYKRLIYNKKGKVLLILLQAAAIAVIAFCLVSISFWMEDSWSLDSLSQSYEESELFFRRTGMILSNKIRGQDNARLLETDGEFDRQKQIDIQSYDETGYTVQDLNTTYLLGDLLDFYENGGWQALHDAIEAANASENDREAGEQLDEQSQTLETILPVTGISLAECSRWYSDAAGYVEEMYTQLDEACEDLYERYVEYTTVQNESWSAEAPSNLLYCIEDTSSGELYTNTGAETYEEAVELAEAEEEFTSLYEGERSFNIMVSNPDQILNAEAAEWFLEQRFVGTNEKVYVAVNTSYPVSDELQTGLEFYAQRENLIRNAGIGAIAAFALLVFCFVCSLLGTGKKEDGTGRNLQLVDAIPTELAAGIYLILAIVFSLIASGWEQISGFLPGEERIQVAVVFTSAWLIFLSACMGFARRFSAGTLWTNSVIRTLIRTWRQVNSSRAASGQLILQYIGFFVLNFLFLLLFGRAGLVLVVLLDMAVLLYLMRDMAGKQNIYEGIHQLSQGDLQYRIDTTALQGESLRMAEAVNEMGDSLCAALEAIVKNERLKAELITNVSHDLKTPLTSIVNYVDLLKRENLENERARGYVGILEQKSQRLKQLTEDLVEASKISSGNVELEIVRMQAQSMLMQACGEFEERFKEHGLTFIWEMQKEPVYIMADGRQLWRILENLLGNICKYAKENTDVRVILQPVFRTATTPAVFSSQGNSGSGDASQETDGVSRAGSPSADSVARTNARNALEGATERNKGGKASAEPDEVIIELRNISREEITIEADELTGRFVRGDASRSSEGSGLGLSIAQNLAELLDGSLRISLQDGVFTATLRFPTA